MVLDLRSVFADEGKSILVDSEFDLSSLELYGGYPLKNPVKVSGTVYNRVGIVTLDVVCEVEYSAPCDRCGIDAVKTYRISIKRTLVNEIQSDENDEMILLEAYKLDLDKLVYSEVVLGVPTKHLCREDCKGICSKCGKNLNSGNCACPEREIDPRMAPLAELLK